MRILFSCLLIIIVSFNKSLAQSLIQVTGVTMTSDSMEAIPFIPIKVNNDDLGIRSNYNGVFSLTCRKGDKLTFGGVGFEEKSFTIPANLNGAHYSMVLFLNHDTFYLPTVIFRQEIPSGRDFDYALRYWDMDDDIMLVGKRNATTNDMDYQVYALPHSGAEAQWNMMSQSHTRGSYQNMVPSVNLTRIPEFLGAWRRGDLKMKKYKNPLKK